MKPRLSLKGRGLQLLSQREHSRSELRRKLLAYARTQAKAAASLDATPAPEVEVSEDEAPAQVELVLEWLQANRYLCEERFVESRVHARAARFGNQRIRLELAQHGVALSADAAQQLKDSELVRARDLWSRRFGQVAADAAGRARQVRFLAGRGFSGEVIRRVVQARSDDD